MIAPLDSTASIMSLKSSDINASGAGLFNKKSTTKKRPLSATISPAEYVQCLIPEQFQPKTTATERRLSLNKTQASDGYTMEVVGAIRANDVAALRHMLYEQNKSFDVCNVNGEYLIHLACRRAAPETVEFLIHEAHVRLDVCDTMGRTILHDCVWKASPDLAMMETLLPLVPPSLWVTPDIRGHVPFDFARKEHWTQWNEFLQQQQDVLQQRLFAWEQQQQQQQQLE
mmetsp:Transcript_7537/g.14288  ORF Transcript_7537/g.14288 Transcript_7537/m.14288 type:complete len:228 (-) Transcript_7537:129-812(-)